MLSSFDPATFLAGVFYLILGSLGAWLLVRAARVAVRYTFHEQKHRDSMETWLPLQGRWLRYFLFTTFSLPVLGIGTLISLVLLLSGLFLSVSGLLYFLSLIFHTISSG